MFGGGSQVLGLYRSSCSNSSRLRKLFRLLDFWFEGVRRSSWLLVCALLGFLLESGELWMVTAWLNRRGYVCSTEELGCNSRLSVFCASGSNRSSQVKSVGQVRSSQSSLVKSNRSSQIESINQSIREYKRLVATSSSVNTKLQNQWRVCQCPGGICCLTTLLYCAFIHGSETYD